VLLLTLPVGCVFKGVRDILTRPATRADLWQPQPVRIRVYPTSRFATYRDGKAVVLDARIELLDEMDDSIKAAGEFHFELLDELDKGRTALARRLYSWDVPMFTLEEQRQHYDKVTRAYLFRLKMDEPFFPAKDTTLKAVYIPPKGRTLKDETVMRGSTRTE